MTNSKVNFGLPGLNLSYVTQLEVFVSNFQKSFITIFIIAFLSCGCTEISSIISSESTDKIKIALEHVWKKEPSESADKKVSASPRIVSEHILNGESSENGQSIAIAPDGIVWVAGSTENIEGVEASPSQKDDREGWLIGIDPKKSKSEQIVYNRRFGGNHLDTLYYIAIGKDGIIWLVGQTNSDAQTGDIPKSAIWGQKVWILGIDPKKSEDKQIIYNRCFGGDRFLFFRDAAMGEDGVLWIIGHISGSVGLGDAGDIPLSEDCELWLFGVDPKKNVNKQIIYNRCLKGDWRKVCLDVGKDGTLWVVGRTNDSEETEAGDIFNNKYKEQDLWVLGIDPNKSKQIVYGQNFGGDGYENLASIAVDEDGILWVLGTTRSKKGSGDIPKGYNILSEMWLFGIDSKKSEGKQIIYNRCFDQKGFLSGSLDFPEVMAIDKDGLICIAGMTRGSITTDIWLTGIDTKKSESAQSVFNQFIYKKDNSDGKVNMPTSITIGEDGIVWTTGIFKRNAGNYKYQSELWIVGTKP